MVRSLVLPCLFGGVVATFAGGAARAAGPPSGQPGSDAAPVRLRHLRVVAIDPGHGGENRGCLGVGGAFEKEATLAIARRVARILNEETDAAVLMTRDADVSIGLRERTRLANAWDADVFVSIHLNADPKGIGSGVETWFLAPEAADAEAERLVRQEEESDVAAGEIAPDVRQAALSVVLDARIRAAQAESEALAEEVGLALERETGAKLRGVKQAPFGVLKEATMPAIVVEGGFFTDGVEGMRLVDPEYQERVARGVVLGLVSFDRRLGAPEETAEAAPAQIASPWTSP